MEGKISKSKPGSEKMKRETKVEKRVLLTYLLLMSLLRSLGLD